MLELTKKILEWIHRWSFMRKQESIIGSPSVIPAKAGIHYLVRSLSLLRKQESIIGSAFVIAEKAEIHYCFAARHSCESFVGCSVLTTPFLNLEEDYNLVW